MQLLTQNLPSGYPYDFTSLKVMPMFFAQILEYMENVPTDPIEKFYFDYKLIQQDDPNIDRVLVSDIPFIVFMKKALTIGTRLEFNSTLTCPACGTQFQQMITMSQLKFNPLDDEARKGFIVEFNGKRREVRMPTMAEFMVVFNNYRRYRRVTDMKLIKLISLFKDAMTYQQMIEEDVVNATYDDITLLAALDQIYFNTLNSVTCYCPKCNLDVEPDKKRGMEVSIESLISNLFRGVIENNRLTTSKIVSQ